jgi:hypothetical protein
MFGLAVLFFFGVWVLGTILFMVLGWKAKRHFGLFVGFMLPMGNFIVYWAVEYWMLQVRVTRLCETSGGTKVYLTPEEYRKRIGEEEWNNIHEINKLIHVEDGVSNISFQGREYKPQGYENSRIRSFDIRNEIKGITETDVIYYDYRMHQVVFQTTTFGVNAPSLVYSLEGLKFWLNNIQDCSRGDLSYEDRFRVYQYKP